MTFSGASPLHLAYVRDRLATVKWRKERLNLEVGPTSLDEALTTLKEEPLAFVLDGQGALYNRPLLKPLSKAPEECKLWVDSGVRKGEDVMDLVMADVGSPILPVRHLSGPAEVRDAADICEELMVALDWADGWVTGGRWRTLSLEELGDLLLEWELRQLLVYHHSGALPVPMPESWQQLMVYVVEFKGHPCPWAEATVVRPLELSDKVGLP